MLLFFFFVVDARNKFKEYVNTLATIKNEEVSVFYGIVIVVFIRVLVKLDLLVASFS